MILVGGEALYDLVLQGGIEELRGHPGGGPFNTARTIVRLEQLYPVPMRDLRATFDAYSKAEEIVWVQEEPENMGAWDFIRPHLVEVSSGRPVRRIARPRSASPAEGSAARHALNQQALFELAFADRGGARSEAPPSRTAEQVAR